ncbi:MAG: RsmE family RNA methyltransferase [Thermodesulfobacteriota bacterium]
MKKRRVVILPDELSPQGVLFSRAHSHYLVNVLRLGIGAEIFAQCGRNEYLVRLTVLEGGRLSGSASFVGVLPDSGCVPLVLAFGCVRPGPVEEILRHGTELGVSSFVPIVTRRTTRRPDSPKRRWTAVVACACSQSGRGTIPEVEAPVTLDRFLTRDHGETCKMLLSTDRASTPMLEVLEERRPAHVTILVGPEGGLDPSEEQTAITEGFHPVMLTETVLKTETACIAAVGLVACWSRRSLGELRDPSCGLPAD